MILDEARLREITRNKPALMATLAKLFLDEFPSMVDGIEECYRTADRQAVSHAVHRMKSALGNFATREFYDAFATLESSAMTQDLDAWHLDWQRKREKLDQLRQELGQLAEG
ncbi:Hpt domain-containing protein [Spongiibacter tropicus]|uniref:Hpt domain-containing protein n=1 Tax=Spongiibacter tropicus TaxID=454602 RepID=UPI0003B3430E|nr:Hpt domain-containing protein [Spongiibacter tropicus]